MGVKIIKPEDTFGIRKKVLRENIPLPYEFPGDFDENTIHFGYFVDDQLVSVASIMKSSHDYFSETNQYQLRGMATLTEFQGQSIGSKLLLEVMQFIEERQAELLWFNARIKALTFYKKLGFETIGAEFDINYVGGHYVMYKHLKRS